MGSASDRGDLERRQAAAESFGFVKALTAFEFEGDALGSAVLADDLSGHRSTFHGGSADFNGLAFADDQRIELDFRIHRGVEFLDVEFGALLDAVLFTAGFDHCVGHGRIWEMVEPPVWAGRGDHHGPTRRASFFCPPREILVKKPQISPKSSTWTKSTPILHAWEDTHSNCTCIPSMSIPEINPYAAPTDLTAGTPPLATSTYFRDGKFLIVRDGTELPAVCPVTNQPVEQGWRQCVTFTWTPQWVVALILVNVLIMIIVSLILQKKARVTYSLSAQTRKKIIRKKLLGGGLIAVALGGPMVALIAITMDHHSGSIPLVVFFISCPILLITGLVMLILSNPLKATGHKNGWMRIKGCSTDFLATLPTFASPF